MSDSRDTLVDEGIVPPSFRWPAERCAYCEQPADGANTLERRNLGMTIVTVHRYACPSGEDN